MNRLNIEELKHKSQALQDIAADYLHLAQTAHSEVDTVRNARGTRSYFNSLDRSNC